MPRTNLIPKLNGLSRWSPPEHWQQIQTFDLHTEGEPLRVVVAGFPELKGSSIADYQQHCRMQWDHLRTALMWEPRGHADMYGCLLTPPLSEEADFGIFFLHNEGYSSMCGHAIIAIAKLVVEMELIPPASPLTQVNIDTPAGLVTAYVRIREGKAEQVYFHNVPAFVTALDESVEVDGIGRVSYDLAFGGAFYAFVQAESLGLSLTPAHTQQLIIKGMAIKRAVMAKSPHIRHPFDENLSFLYGTIFIGEALAGGDSRNVCIFAEGEVDRSPTGTGVSGRLAIHHARGELAKGESMLIESIIGTRFRARIVEETRFGPLSAVIPEVEGRAYITGRHTFFIDPEDPLKHGFLLR
ncbi:MAG: proline racemase [Bacteroidetes bacterium]|nr:MAG: proline racemase [Bacteroidota bacterium]